MEKFKDRSIVEPSFLNQRSVVSKINYSKDIGVTLLVLNLQLFGFIRVNVAKLRGEYGTKFIVKTLLVYIVKYGAKL